MPVVILIHTRGFSPVIETRGEVRNRFNGFPNGVNPAVRETVQTVIPRWGTLVTGLKPRCEPECDLYLSC